MANPNASQEVENNNREFWMNEINAELEIVEALEKMDAALEIWELVQDVDVPDYVLLEADLLVEDAEDWLC